MSVGLLTNEGLNATVEANNNNGWFIYPTKFLVSSTYNIIGIVAGRTDTTLEPTWYTGLLSGGTKISDTILQFNAYIPPNQNGGVSIDIAEIYVFAEGKPFTFTTNYLSNNTILTIPSGLGAVLVNGTKITLRVNNGDTLPVGFIATQTYYVNKLSSTQIKLCLTKADAIAGTNFVTFSSNGIGTLLIQKEFLLAIGGTSPTSTYDPVNGSTNLRLQIQLASAGDPALFKFLYTQAQEISDHNLDPNAHPKIVTELNIGGMFVDGTNFDYKGQTFDEVPVFEGGTVDGNALYIKADGTYGKAKADGSIKEVNFVGFRQDSFVKTQGYVNIGTHGFALGAKVYLSPTTAGNLTTTANNSEVGIVKSANTIYLTKHFIPTISLSSGVVVQDHGSGSNTATTFNFTGRTKMTFNTGVATVTVSSPITNTNITAPATTTLYSPDVTPKDNYYSNISGTPANGNYIFTFANPVATDDYKFNITFDGQVRNQSSLVINLEATQVFDSLNIANAVFSNTNKTVTIPCVSNGNLLQSFEMVYAGSDKFVITNVNYVPNPSIISNTTGYLCGVVVDISNATNIATITNTTNVLPDNKAFMHTLTTGDAILTTPNSYSPLSSGTAYYLRKLSATTFKLYPTKSDALANTNEIVFSSNYSNAQMRFIDKFSSSFFHVIRNKYINLDYSSSPVFRYLELPSIADIDPNNPCIYINNQFNNQTLYVRINPTEFTAGVSFYSSLLFGQSFGFITPATGNITLDGATNYDGTLKCIVINFSSPFTLNSSFRYEQDLNAWMFGEFSILG